MKKRGKFFVIFSLVYFMTFMVSTANSKIEPLGISPGNDLGIAIVDHSCPTFSWASVDWATGYKLVVFKADSAVVFTYGEISALQTPILQKRIMGKALSWTPSSKEGLTPGNNYLWYVQATEDYGTEVWSAGRSFRIELPVIPWGLEEELKNKLKEEGLSDESITNVFAGVRSEGKDSNNLSKTNNTPGKVTGTEGATYTFYGTNAGNGTMSGSWNSFFGVGAGHSDTTGYYNTFLGDNAGYANTTGYQNTFSGANSGYSNTIGYNNTFYGNNTGGVNVSGNNNTFSGHGVGSSNTSGNNNSFFGYLAGQANTFANANTFFGAMAGNSNTFANSNVFVGYACGLFNTTGTPNTFIGCQAGVDNTTENFNTFVGYRAGYENKGGYNNTFLGNQAGMDNTTGDYNTFFGSSSGENNTIGHRNTFSGYQAGYSNTIGYHNTFSGTYTGYSNSSGYHNTFSGYMAGYYNSSGSGNTFSGYMAGYSNSSGSGNVLLGTRAGQNETGSNTLYIDNSNTSSPLIYGEFDNNLIRINGNFQATGYLSLDNGSTQIISTELNLLDGRTSVATGTSNNNILVTKGYVDENDSVGVGLTGSAMTNIFIPKWDDGNTRFVDSIMSEGTGTIGINGSLGIGTSTPAQKVEIKTTGELAVFQVTRTDGTTFKLAAGVANTQIGTISNHGIKFTTNNTWKMRLNAGGTLDMADGGSYNGTWNDASSIEFKENIREMSSDEAKYALEELNPVIYNYKKYKDEERAGFIAEHVPEIVANKDRKNLSAMDIVAVLTKVVKEQQKSMKEQLEIIKELNAEQQKKFVEQQKAIIELKEEIYKLKKNIK